MYSPKIDARYVPPLYRAAKTRGVFMTTLVNEVIAAFLAQQPDPSVTPANRSRPRASGCAPGPAERWTDATRRAGSGHASDPRAPGR